MSLKAETTSPQSSYFYQGKILIWTPSKIEYATAERNSKFKNLKFCYFKSLCADIYNAVGSRVNI